MKLHVLYADNHLLVVLKPSGVPTVPDSSGDESMLDRAREHLKVVGGKPGRAFVGVVHRLDRPVSGTLVLARTSKAAERLAAQFRGGGVRKIYWGICTGAPSGEEGEVEQWLLKDESANRVAVASRTHPDARRCLTRWRLLERQGEHCLIEWEPRTGRAHQIRLAAASVASPLLGDLKYGAPRALPDRSIALHALSIALDHPTRGERKVFQSLPPERAWWMLWRDSRVALGESTYPEPE